MGVPVLLTRNGRRTGRSQRDDNNSASEVAVSTITRVTVRPPRCEVEARARLAASIRRLPAESATHGWDAPNDDLLPSLMKASTVGENLRSCQAVSTMMRAGIGL
jgi:hypothetical protein